MITLKCSAYLYPGLLTRRISDTLWYLNAGCETAPQVGPFTNHDIYHRTCIDVIMANNCPDSTICAINCASNGPINATTSHILPINNYGNYYLRIRLCMDTVHPQSLKRFSTVNIVFCEAISDFTVCSRFIPPHSFIPVAIPKSVSSIVIDSCEIINGTYACHNSDPAPQRLYGNKFMFPSTYDVPVPDGSSCLHDCESNSISSDIHFLRIIYLGPKKDDNFLTPVLLYNYCDGFFKYSLSYACIFIFISLSSSLSSYFNVSPHILLAADCLGSYCDMHRNPHLCSPKSLRNALGPGSMYFADPYGG